MATFNSLAYYVYGVIEEGMHMTFYFFTKGSYSSLR